MYEYYRAADREAAPADPERPRVADSPRVAPASDAVDAGRIDPEIEFCEALPEGSPYLEEPAVAIERIYVRFRYGAGPSPLDRIAES